VVPFALLILLLPLPLQLYLPLLLLMKRKVWILRSFFVKIIGSNREWKETNSNNLHSRWASDGPTWCTCTLLCWLSIEGVGTVFCQSGPIGQTVGQLGLKNKFNYETLLYHRPTSSFIKTAPLILPINQLQNDLFQLLPRTR